MSMLVKVELLAAEAKLPAYQTDGSAGADLYASEAFVIPPGESLNVDTRIALDIPAGFFGYIRPRSGLAARQQVGVIHSSNVIDSDYRGPIIVVCTNGTSDPVIVQKGERFAQLLILPVVQAVFGEVEALSATIRNEGGFGSTKK